jgi:hypothetical protein
MHKQISLVVLSLMVATGISVAAFAENAPGDADDHHPNHLENHDRRADQAAERSRYLEDKAHRNLAEKDAEERREKRHLQQDQRQDQRSEMWRKRDQAWDRRADQHLSETKDAYLSAKNQYEQDQRNGASAATLKRDLGRLRTDQRKFEDARVNAQRTEQHLRAARSHG